MPPKRTRQSARNSRNTPSKEPMPDLEYSGPALMVVDKVFDRVCVF